MNYSVNCKGFLQDIQIQVTQEQGDTRHRARVGPQRTSELFAILGTKIRVFYFHKPLVRPANLKLCDWNHLQFCSCMKGSLTIQNYTEMPAVR